MAGDSSPGPKRETNEGHCAYVRRGIVGRPIRDGGAFISDLSGQLQSGKVQLSCIFGLFYFPDPS